MSSLVIFIVIAIICMQLFFFVKNVHRMKEYKEIFSEKSSWDIEHFIETGFVAGISGQGNKVFESIKNSINEYLGNNSGSVIEFSLLKDAVDRHCDSVENDINALTPVPLYCGLAGTMAGVIIGLTSLIATGAITSLLAGNDGGAAAVGFGAAAVGVNDLLSGVAWAMLASICGIFLTTLSSLLFKQYKLIGESGKNTFLAWLQAKLLPELPSDTSDALNRLVVNLNKFNDTFAENTTSLRGALTEVNESYRIQAQVIQAVHDMDVMKMAKANVRVLQELKECTDKLEQFNQYLDDIHGYTDAIHMFTTKFEQESDRLNVLEEIRNYFERHKAEIAKDTAEADVALRDALSTLKDTASTNTNDFHATLVQQAEEFKSIIREEKESFVRINEEIRTQFGNQLNRIPEMEKQLEQISSIPGKLDELIKRLDRSNSALASQVSSTMKQTAKDLTTVSASGGASPYAVQVFPGWMKWTIVVAVILIALACIGNTAYNIWTDYKKSHEVAVEAVEGEASMAAEEASVVEEQSVAQTAVSQAAQGAIKGDTTQPKASPAPQAKPAPQQQVTGNQKNP